MKRSIRVSYDNILDKLHAKFGDDIVMLTSKEEYLGTHYKCKFKCNKCNRIFELSINKILTTDNGCSECSKKRISYDNLVSILNVKNIIVIDDVTTTGATLGEVKKVLLEGGVRKVFCVAIAH